MKMRILLATVALMSVSGMAFGDEIDNRFQKARKYLNDHKMTITTTVEQAFTQLAAGQRPAMTLAARCGLRAELRSWHVRAVLVQPDGQRSALVMPFFEWLLGRPPDARSGGISTWYGPVPRARC